MKIVPIFAFLVAFPMLFHPAYGLTINPQADVRCDITSCSLTVDVSKYLNTQRLNMVKNMNLTPFIIKNTGLDLAYSWSGSLLTFSATIPANSSNYWTLNTSDITIDPWFNSSFTRARMFTINNSLNGTYKAAYTAIVMATNNTDVGDWTTVRWTQEDNTTLLKWRIYENTTTQAEYHINFTMNGTLGAGATTTNYTKLFMWYGNTSVGSGEASNESEVYGLFGDYFNRANGAIGNGWAANTNCQIEGNRAQCPGAGGSWVMMNHTFSSISERTEYGFLLNTTNTGVTNGPRLGTVDNNFVTGAGCIWGVDGNSADKFQYFNGAAWVSFADIADLVTYRLTTQFFNTTHANITINGTTIANAKCGTTSTVSNVSYGIIANTVKGYLDNVYVRVIVLPQPTVIEASAQEQQAAPPHTEAIDTKVCFKTRPVCVWTVDNRIEIGGWPQ